MALVSIFTLPAILLMSGHTQARPAQSAVAQRRPADILVTGQVNDDTPAKLEFLLPEVDGAKITVTKKASTTKLNSQPTVIANNQQQLFARTPGLLVTDQITPGQLNLSYRGLGNPQESEYVLVLQDGLPISTDWIGFPTLYYTPLPQGISEVQMIRGGSSLIYGPEPAPAINFVSKRPRAGERISGYGENVVGSDGLLSSYDTVEGSVDKFEYRAAYGHVENDGQRHNQGSSLDQADLYLAYRAKTDALFFLAANYSDVSTGDPGKLGYTQFLNDPAYATTPYNHDWIRRTSVTGGARVGLGSGWSVDAKLWAVWQTLHNRTADNQAPGVTPPPTTTIADERFRSQGLDVRAIKRWGQGNALTIGAVAYRDDAPYRQWITTDLLAARETAGGTPRLDQARASYYQAVFAENVFRLPHHWHVVPSFRLDHETINIAESVRPPNLTRPLIDTHVSRTVALLGLGLGFDFGKQNETYFSVTQGYRPLRFFDVASPFSNAGARTVADPQKSISFEAGVHGTPVSGLFYDVSLFRIGFRNRIETVVLNNTDTVNLNSGDTLHQGFEGQVSYDFLAHRKSKLHLVAFGNLVLLDAKFTSSRLAGQVGKTPAYAPSVIGKYGLSLRREGVFNISATAVTEASQYWQDSNTSFGIGSSFIPSKVPGFTVADIAFDFHLASSFRLVGGVTNIADRHYYDRVFRNGIEPARDRKIYGGVALGF